MKSKTQVFIIHGGHARDSYEDYLNHLIRKEINLEDLHRKDWKYSIDVRLGDKYDVYNPQMPNKENAKYAE